MQTEQAPKPTATPRDAHARDRGREADKPSDVPAKGWRDILIRTKDQLSANNVSIVSAGVAFYCFLAFVPALGAVISVYALVASPATVSSHIEALAGVLPGEALPLVKDQVTRLTSASQAAGISAVISFLLALYGATNAIKALIQGLNITYNEPEKRGFIKLQLVALVLTLGAVVGTVLALGLIAVVPVALKFLHLSSGAESLVNWLRWPVVLVAFMIGLAVLYRYAPSRDSAKWRWVSWGAVAAALVWALASAGFSLYVATIGNYEKTYGSLGALVVFLMWLYLSAYVVLAGAELNAEMERQTRKDTTTGKPEPMGRRRAQAADTVGPARAK